MSREPKQVILARKDLKKMGPGKLAAQVAHASMGALLAQMGKGPERTLRLEPGSAMQEWLDNRFTKVVLGVESEADLHAFHERAKAAGLPCCLIKDAGLTCFKEPTYTTLAIGPAWPEELQPLTGELKLL